MLKIINEFCFCKIFLDLIFRVQEGKSNVAEKFIFLSHQNDIKGMAQFYSKFFYGNEKQSQNFKLSFRSFDKFRKDFQNTICCKKRGETLKEFFFFTKFLSESCRVLQAIKYFN